MSSNAALLVPFALLAVLGGCGGSAKDVDVLDGELLNTADGNQTDPALMSALEDQIMVDPALAQQSNRHSVRPAGEPAQAPIPPGVDPAGDTPGGGDRPTLGELAQAQGRRTAQQGGCYADLAYSHGWANRLPTGVPLYPDAAVSEAAGNDLPGCRIRVVSYASAATVPTLIRFYVAQARRAGYSADYTRRDGDLIVAGDRPDGTAFYVAVTPRGRTGSDVDIVTNNGR